MANITSQKEATYSTTPYKINSVKLNCALRWQDGVALRDFKMHWKGELRTKDKRARASLDKPLDGVTGLLHLIIHKLKEVYIDKKISELS
ncbi:hypothetical protein QE152_g26949 [Popillia japonica]|uniref:Uncharacterized protein n=1 Tax=Popillia japonica TaxID=7064 RepID=A0AAW1JXR9_POPJA